MRPKEIQEMLGIDADRIKFFKREGVFCPENPPDGSKSTNYTDVDLANLRLLVVLTKSGLTCSDVRKLQEGKHSLKDVIIHRQKSIKADIARKQSAMSLLSEILDDKAEFETFETNHYWDVITRREGIGEEFIDVENIYEEQNVSLVRGICCPCCGAEYEVDLEDYVWDQSSYEKENGMGPDIVYSFNSEDNYNCPECDVVIQIEGWIREYPVGAYDSEDINVEVMKMEK